MSFLADLGIQFFNNADTDLRRFGQRMGFMPLSWREVIKNNPSRDGLMWRIPDPAVPMVTSLLNVQAILVTEYEQAIVLRNGRFEGEEAVLQSGLYDIRRVGNLRGQIEVIWFTKGEIHLPWGVGDAGTKEGVSVGGSGHYIAAIVDPYMFLNKVIVGHHQVFKEQQLLEFARGTVNGAMKYLIAGKNVMELERAQPELEEACKEKLMREFQRWGLEFLGLTIERWNIPEEYRQLAMQESMIDRQKNVQIKGAVADITLAQLEMLKAQYAALAEANHLRLIGAANAEIMQSQMGIGLDPLELQKIEAIKILAAHPSEGALTDNRPQIVSQLQPPLPSLSSPPVIVTGVPLATPVQQLSVAGSLSAGAPPAQSASAEPMTPEKIEEMLDKLDERFANGEISEQVYLTLQSKWQKRLEKLP